SRRGMPAMRWAPARRNSEGENIPSAAIAASVPAAIGCTANQANRKVGSSKSAVVSGAKTAVDSAHARTYVASAQHAVQIAREGDRMRTLTTARPATIDSCTARTRVRTGASDQEVETRASATYARMSTSAAPERARWNHPAANMAMTATPTSAN